VTDLWAACRSGAIVSDLGGELTRVVESQEQIATSELVDDLAAQSLLEELIEGAKPPLRPGTERLHYLLAAPFRYPPLRHGSRFGSRHEPGLFYGACRLATALAETAFYRFLFWLGMTAPPPGGRLLTQHTSFAARYQAARGVRLQEPPCSRFRSRLTDREHYATPQALGATLRRAGVEAFEYESARDLERGTNVALISPAALRSRRPLRQAHWLCDTTAERVQFSQTHRAGFHGFPLADFLVHGRFPHPAD
jgi:hypothetical protein